MFVLLWIWLTIYITKLKKHNNSYKELHEKLKSLNELKKIKETLRKNKLYSTTKNY
jgi:hypothetical protein